jgi:hypothetical protein
VERRRQRVAALILGLLVPAMNAASAEPVAIMSGQLTSAATSHAAEFRLTGTDGFELAGSWPGFFIPCDCRIGGTLDASSRFAYEQVPFVLGDPFAFGRGVVGGQPVAGFLSGALVFSTPQATIPTLQLPTDQDTRFTLMLPFTFSGRVQGYEDLQGGPPVPPPLFDVALFGIGMARIEFIGLTLEDGRTPLTYLSTTYEFAPVPEPGTLALLGTAVGGAFAARLRRRRRPERSRKTPLDAVSRYLPITSCAAWARKM